MIGAALLAPLVLLPLIAQPTLGIALTLAVAVVVLASRSIAYPVGLATLPAVVLGAIGHNPFPPRAVGLFVALWILLGIALDRATEERLPLRVLLSGPVVLTVALGVWMVLRLSATPLAASGYGTSKTQLFLASNVPLVLAGVLIGRKRRHLDLYVLLTLLVGALAGLVLVKGLATGAAQASVGGRFGLDESGNPIGVGRDAARALLVATFLLLGSRAVSKRILALAVTPIVAVPFIAAGSRGPALALVVGLLILFTLTLRDRASRRRVVLVGLGAIVAGLLVTQLVPGHDIQRTLFVLTGSDNSGLSSNGRFGLWSDGWALFAANPLVGAGTGAFAAVRPVGLYPHNLFLEAGAELGLVGALLVIAIVGLGIVSVARAWRAADGAERRWPALVGALLAAALTNAMFSSDLPNNDAVWLAVGLAVGLASATGASRPTLLAIRGRRATRRVEARAPAPRRERPAGAPRTTPTPRGVVRSPGAITAPRDGATVSGTTLVRAVPAETGWGVSALRIEVRPAGGEWREVAAARDEAFDLIALEEGEGQHVAVVRSRRVAELVRGALEPLLGRIEVTSSSRRPWRTGAARTVVWEAGELEPGDYEVRAVTFDVARSRVESPPVAVAVAPASEAPAAAAPELGPLSGAGSELSLVTLAAEREQLQRLRAELERREGERQTAAEELRARTIDLQAREAQASLREREVERLSEDADDRLAAATAAERELAAAGEALRARGADVAARTDDVERREQALADAEARSAALADATARVSARQAELTAHERSLGERDAILSRRGAELDALQRELAAREREVAAREAELAVHAEELDRRDAVIAEAQARAGAIADAAARVAAREAELAQRLEQAEVRERELERRERLAETRLHEAEARLATLEATAEAFDARRRRLPEPPPPPVAAPVAPPPEPEPEPRAPEPERVPVAVAPREPEPAPVAGEAAVRLWTLERLVADHRHPDPYVQAEREALLLELRSYADASGAIPAQFAGLVDEVFGELYR